MSLERFVRIVIGLGKDFVGALNIDHFPKLFHVQLHLDIRLDSPVLAALLFHLVPVFDPLAARKVIVGHRVFQLRIAPRIRRNHLHTALAVSSRPNESRSLEFLVLEGAGHNLRGAGRLAVDQNDQRIIRMRPTLVGVFLRGDTSSRLALDDHSFFDKHVHHRRGRYEVPA